MDETPAIPPTMTPKSTLSKMPGQLKSYLMGLNIKTDKKLFIATLIYLAILILMRWRLSPKLDIFFFLAGGILGVQFLELVETIFKDLSAKKSLEPVLVEQGNIPGRSSVKNVLCQSVFVPLSLFVITSSGSLFGTGLVLSISFSMLYWQWQEYNTTGKIASWLWVIKTEIDQKTQQIYLAIMGVLFIFLSMLFV